MPVNIHGKEYITVAERIAEAHKSDDLLSVETELKGHDPVLFKATIVTKKGAFTGWSAANPSKAIEKQSPYEVAETSAVGRALGFAGFGSVESIASAEEIIKATNAPYDSSARQETAVKQGSDEVCQYHNVKMFKTPRMKSFAHRDDVRGWCNGAGYSDEKEDHRESIKSSKNINAEPSSSDFYDVSEEIPF